jgi:hypothetical protein
MLYFVILRREATKNLRPQKYLFYNMLVILDSPFEYFASLSRKGGIAQNDNYTCFAEL